MCCPVPAELLFRATISPNTKLPEAKPFSHRGECAQKADEPKPECSGQFQIPLFCSNVPGNVPCLSRMRTKLARMKPVSNPTTPIIAL